MPKGMMDYVYDAVPDSVKRMMTGQGQQVQGYKLYVQDSQANGQPILPYEEWIKQQAPLPEEKKVGMMGEQERRQDGIALGIANQIKSNPTQENTAKLIQFLLSEQSPAATNVAKQLNQIKDNPAQLGQMIDMIIEKLQGSVNG